MLSKVTLNEVLEEHMKEVDRMKRWKRLKNLVSHRKNELEKIRESYSDLLADSEALERQKKTFELFMSELRQAMSPKESEIQELQSQLELIENLGIQDNSNDIDMIAQFCERIEVLNIEQMPSLKLKKGWIEEIMQIDSKLDTLSEHIFQTLVRIMNLEAELDSLYNDISLLEANIRATYNPIVFAMLLQRCYDEDKKMNSVGCEDSLANQLCKLLNKIYIIASDFPFETK